MLLVMWPRHPHFILDLLHKSNSLAKMTSKAGLTSSSNRGFSLAPDWKRTLVPLAKRSACFHTDFCKRSTAESALAVGQVAPSIDIVDANGKMRRLSDLRDKKALLLTFFPKCFTGNCTNQVISLRDAYPELQKQDVEVWGVSTDPSEGPHGQAAFIKRYRLPFALLPDTNRALCLAYGAVQSKEQMAARMSVLIGKDGKTVWIDKQIDPRTHGADVVVRLQQEQDKTKTNGK